MHISRAGAHVPHVLRRAFAVNVAAARLGMKSTIDAFAVMLPDPVWISTSPTPISSISMSPLPALTRAGPESSRRARSRARLEVHFTGEAHQLHVARPLSRSTLPFSLRPSDRRCRYGLESPCSRNGDFVVDRMLRRFT